MALDLLGRIWWLPPYLDGRTTGANRFTTRLRNAWRRRHGLPGLPDALALQRARAELLGAMTLAYPGGSADCPHAPNCSQATGCHDGTVPSSWAQLREERDGVWFAHTWAHPRETRMHRSTTGEPLDGVPKYARGKP